jgi:hypothetical protein
MTPSLPLFAARGLVSLRPPERWTRVRTAPAERGPSLLWPSNREEAKSVNASPGVPTAMRPLGIGELLDRAVTLWVRNFWTMSALYVGFAVLLEALTVLSGNQTARALAAMTDTLRHQGDPNASAAAIKALTQSSGATGPVIALSALIVFILPLPLGALAAAASAICKGGTLTFAQAYRVGLSAWPRVLAAGLLFIVGALLAYVALIFVVVVAFAALAVLGAKGAAVAIGVLFGLVALVLLLVVAIFAGLAYQLALFACVVEGAGPVTALGSAFRRVFARGQRGRSFVAGIAYWAISFGVAIVSLTGSAVVLALTKTDVAGALFNVIVSVSAMSFQVLFLMLFYYDLRVREEGLDLQIAAGALVPASAQP